MSITPRLCRNSWVDRFRSRSRVHCVIFVPCNTIRRIRMRLSALAKFLGVLGVAASPLISAAVAQAEPVTDWVTVFAGATFTDGSEETNSPTIIERGQITANIAPITLAEVGDSVTLTGSVTF